MNYILKLKLNFEKSKSLKSKEISAAGPRDEVFGLIIQEESDAGEAWKVKKLTKNYCWSKTCQQHFASLGALFTLNYIWHKFITLKLSQLSLCFQSPQVVKCGNLLHK